MNLLAFFSNLAGPDLIIILVLVLVLFGAKKLPELARGMGQAMKEFQKAKDDFTGEISSAAQPRPTVAPRDTVAANPARLEANSPATPERPI